jgi:tritrans,polycis-undecaprenyl-diphosphate synthase [geranylgeranyl-diphosphate specific]
VPRLARIARKLASALGVYKLYEKLLESEVRSGGNIPSHVAVILDGNRRWAREEGVPLEVGYREGARRVEEFLRWCYDLGVRTVTLYALSTENLSRRSPEEIQLLLGILREYLRKELQEGELVKRRVRVKAIGFPELLPPDIAEGIRELERRTEGFSERFLNVAVAYGGRAEIVEAARRIAGDVVRGALKLEDINEETFERYLQTSHLPNPLGARLPRRLLARIQEDRLSESSEDLPEEEPQVRRVSIGAFVQPAPLRTWRTPLLASSSVLLAELRNTFFFIVREKDYLSEF